MDVNEYLGRPEVRAQILKQFNKSSVGNWQNVATPQWIANGITGLVEDSDSLRYVIMYSIEFLEVLIFVRGIPRERVMFMADTKHEAAAAMKIFRVKTFELPGSVRSPKETIRRLKTKIRKAFYGEDTVPRANNLVVFGNVPYQAKSAAQKNRATISGSQQAVPIYHTFVEEVIDTINPRYLSFIIPSRWMVGGMGLNDFRKRMMKDKRISKIQHFPGEKEVFENVSIKGGVNYFLWDREHNGPATFSVAGTTTTRNLDQYDIILQDNKALGILEKVRARAEKWMNDTVCGNKPFGLPTNFSNWNDNGNPVTTVKCYSRGRVERRVNRDLFTDRDRNLEKWKVLTSKANGAAQEERDDGKIVIPEDAIFLSEPQSICTETYIVLKACDTREEAENFLSYVRTKFFRFMLSLRLSTQDINKEKFAWVPDLEDYTHLWTDEQLYTRFKLTQEERKYINGRIR